MGDFSSGGEDDNLEKKIKKENRNKEGFESKKKGNGGFVNLGSEVVYVQERNEPNQIGSCFPGSCF